MAPPPGPPTQDSTERRHQRHLVAAKMPPPCRQPLYDGVKTVLLNKVNNLPACKLALVDAVSLVWLQSGSVSSDFNLPLNPNMHLQGFYGYGVKKVVREFESLYWTHSPVVFFSRGC